MQLPLAPCQAPSPCTKVTNPHSKPLSSTKTPKKLADLDRQLDILKIGRVFSRQGCPTGQPFALQEESCPVSAPLRSTATPVVAAPAPATDSALNIRPTPAVPGPAAGSLTALVSRAAPHHFADRTTALPTVAATLARSSHPSRSATASRAQGPLLCSLFSAVWRSLQATLRNPCRINGLAQSHPGGEGGGDSLDTSIARIGTPRKVSITCLFFNTIIQFTHRMLVVKQLTVGSQIVCPVRQQ